LRKNNQMIKKTKIVIVPNSELAEFEDDLRIVKSDKFFYENFSKYNFEVLICAIINKKKKTFGWNINSDNNISYVKQNLKINTSAKKIINYFYTIFVALNVIRKNSFFYLFIPGNVSLIYGIFLMIFRKKYGLYIRGDYMKTNFNFLYNLIISKSQFSIVTGNYLKQHVKPINPNTNLVVPMIITTDKDLYNNRSFPFNKTVNFLFVGRPTKDKGIYELINACSLLKLDGINFELKIVGDADKKANDHLNTIIKDNNLENEILFLGSSSNPNDLKNSFKNSDIFVFPSHHEGFPRVVYEAMTFSLPMVLTNLPSYKYTLVNNIDCELADVKNTHSLYKAMKTLATDPVKYNLYSKNCFEIMKNNYIYFDEKNNHTDQVIKEFSK